MEKRDGFIPKEDYEFEREQAELEAEAQRQHAQAEQERLNAEKTARENYEQELKNKKIELMKLKQGVIESSDIVKEEEKAPVSKLSFGEWVENVWYRSKWLVLFVAFMLVAFGYIIYSTVTKVKPDLTVLAVSDNTGLYARTQEFEEFFGKYCGDINGDGKVYVQFYFINTDYSDATMVSSYQAQLISQLQMGENMIVIQDGSTDFVLHDFRGEFDSECVTEYGIKLNCALTREALKWEAMPEDLYIGLREPQRLFSTTLEAMQENYEEALPVYTNLYEAISTSEK
ncbi:MAG: hypothetical protein IKU89_04205 [Oscillospiraceae bacterium]|nr:hypothetical protein [Oscillospiraceae bacterium]